MFIFMSLSILQYFIFQLHLISKTEKSEDNIKQVDYGDI